MAQKRKRETPRRETKEIDTSWLQQDALPSTESTTQPAWPALPTSVTKPRRRSATATERPPARETVKPPR